MLDWKGDKAGSMVYKYLKGNLPEIKKNHQTELSSPQQVVYAFGVTFTHPRFRVCSIKLVSKDHDPEERKN